MNIITITSGGILVYMQVFGIVAHTILLGWGIAKLMRKIKTFRSKADK